MTHFIEQTLGIINLAAELCLDENRNPAFVYHKYDAEGNLQLYSAYIIDEQWVYSQITNWDYRWEFSGWGSINFEVRLKDFKKRSDGYYEISYWHKKYGDGTILLNDKFENVGSVNKSKSLELTLKVEGGFPGLMVQTSNDIGKSNKPNIRYILRWETLGWNRDEARAKPWPKASKLVLYKLKKEEK